MVKRFFTRILPRRALPVAMLLLQVFLLLHMVLTGSPVTQVANLVLETLSLLLCIYIVAGTQRGAFKIGWVLLILLVPLFGITVYFLFNFQHATRKFRKKVEESCRTTASGFALVPPSTQPLPLVGDYLRQQGFPPCPHTQCRYLSVGEQALEAMLEAMEQARSYIFLEFFIVEEGKMWNAVLEVLRRKAAQGVEVRLIYDDLGCFFLLPSDYPKTLTQWGIQCAPFNPFRPTLTTMQNNRDHRKILSVDGRIAFTGGINLAEYINEVVKFGHWKDTAVRLEGSGAWSLTVMFLQMWQLCIGETENIAHLFPVQGKEGDVAQPYCDSPLDGDEVGQNVYLSIIHNARRYLYITTPYLIVDDNIPEALILAAKRGVDVRIITPHVWDKRLVHVTTRSYYRQLIAGGVKVYEYTPGFIHAKMCVSDDTVATVGTVNLDYRSLYLHFECGTCLYGKAVAAVKADIENTLELCQRIRAEDCRNSLPARGVQAVLRLFAPLM